jgi:glycosyltransferase involved in cell wall biosynthesis
VPFEAVSNGVDLSRFKSGKARADIYDKYNIPKDRPIVLYVGRVDPEKKIGLVIDAFVKMLHNNKLDKVSNPLCLVVGDGVDRLRLEKEYSASVKTGDVKFLGRVTGDDLYELYKVGSLFATASEIETQGIVLIEAAATGLPLIAVKAGAVAEVCRNEENGFLCEPGDVDGISEAMTKILSNVELRKKYSENSIKIAHEHDFEKTLDKFIDIYSKVIRNAK